MTTNNNDPIKKEQTKKRPKNPKDAQPENTAIETPSTVERINRFFRLNNYLIVVLLVVLMLITQCNNSSYKEETIKALKENSYYLKKNISTIGFVSANGMLLTVDRKPIDYNDDRIKKAIVASLTMPFLQGGDEIRAGKVYSNTKEMIKKNEAFNHFYNTFVSKTAQRSALETLGAIHKTLSSLYYPEYIIVKKEKILSFTTERSYRHKDMIKFHTVARYDIRTKSWIVQLGKWIDQDLSIVMEFDGIIDPAKYANADNLLGFKITKLKVPLLQKPSISDLSR